MIHKHTHKVYTQIYHNNISDSLSVTYIYLSRAIFRSKSRSSIMPKLKPKFQYLDLLICIDQASTNLDLDVEVDLDIIGNL